MPLLVYKCRVCQSDCWHEEKTDLTIHGKLPENLAIFECYGCGYLGVKDKTKASKKLGKRDTPEITDLGSGA